jgi:hypothetical protein
MAETRSVARRKETTRARLRNTQRLFPAGSADEFENTIFGAAICPLLCARHPERAPPKTATLYIRRENRRYSKIRSSFRCFHEVLGGEEPFGNLPPLQGALACNEQNSSVFTSRGTDTSRESEAILPTSPRGTLALRLYAGASIFEPANLGA